MVSSRSKIVSGKVEKTSENHVINDGAGDFPSWSAWIVLGAVLAGAAFLRWGLLDVPLERDEGEYAYGGQLLLQGILPYIGIYSMKLPGIYGVYALIEALFGQTIRGIHLGLLVVNALTTALLYRLAREIMPRYGALAAAAFFAVLSAGRSIQGVFANAEHFVLPFAAAGMLLLLKNRQAQRQWLYFASGLLFGAGIVIKQHGGFLAIAAILYVLLDGPWKDRASWRIRAGSSCLLFLGIVLPYGAVCLLYAATGHFKDFWYWTISYARLYASQMPLQFAPRLFRNSTVSTLQSGLPFWLLAAAGLAPLFLAPAFRTHRFFLGLFLSFSCMSIVPGFYFRPHYYLLILPFVALCGGVAVAAIPAAARRFNCGSKAGLAIAAGVAALAIFLSVHQDRNFFFSMTPEEVSRAVYDYNPFPEAIVVADYLKDHTGPNDYVAVLGSEPQVYFYSGRRGATGFVYMYFLMEKHALAREMQHRMMAEIESKQPRYLVYFHNPGSWLRGSKSVTDIFEWLAEYRKGYEMAGFVEVLPDKTIYTWKPEAIQPPKSPFWIAVMKRRGA